MTRTTRNGPDRAELTAGQTRDHLGDRGGRPGRAPRRTGKLFTEEYMAEVYRNQIAILSRLDYVKGISPWILYDFRSPRRQNRYQQGFNRKGLIAADKRTKKAAFQVLQAFYRAKAAEEKE